MKHSKGIVEFRMTALETIQTFHLTKSALAGVMCAPYSRVAIMVEEFKRNKFVVVDDKRLYLTIKGHRILSRYQRLLKDLNIRTAA